MKSIARDEREAMGKGIVVAWSCQEATPWSLLLTFSLTMFFKLFSASLIASLAFLPSPAHARCGIASWYGPGFHGSITASGERFNAYALTAAHRSLPFGSRVRVTNQDTGRSVTLRINDDGPHIPGRIIDLSESAFARIASLGQGVARVCISRV